MEPQRGWQFPASSRPHTSQPAEGLRQQWSLSNGGAINLSGLLETRSEEIGHGSASMSLVLRRDGNTSGGQGRTVVLSPSVGSEGSILSCFIECGTWTAIKLWARMAAAVAGAAQSSRLM